MMMMIMTIMIMMAAFRLVHLNQRDGPLRAEYLSTEEKDDRGGSISAGASGGVAWWRLKL